MPLVILGLVVILCCLGYMYIVNNPGFFTGNNRSKDGDEDEPATVIYLPRDVEREKSKRKK